MYNTWVDMVGIAQSVRALVCGTGGCRFKSCYPPHVRISELHAKWNADKYCIKTNF